MPGNLHEQAVDTLQARIESALGKELTAQFTCKEYNEKHSIDLVHNAADIKRNLSLPGCRPDLAILNEAGKVLTVVEIVVSHAPERNVHQYAIEHGVQIAEFHLPPLEETKYWIRKPRKASDEAVRIKRALENFRAGHLLVDDHNLLCQRPRCNANHPLPFRIVHVQVMDCWNCHTSVRVAVGAKDEEHLYPDDFVPEEREFARQQRVILEPRFSVTAKRRYLANVCGNCYKIQGDWFLHMDPHHDTYRYESDAHEQYGPCDECAKHHCSIPDHGEYVDHADNGCPVCHYLAESVTCHHRHDRECFYPSTCQEQGCYFQRREASQRATAIEHEQIRRAEDTHVREQREQQDGEWAEFTEWFKERSRRTTAEE